MHIYLPDRRAARCQRELLLELTRLLPRAVGDRSGKESDRDKKKKKKKMIDFNERKCNKIFIVSNIYF